MGSSVQPSTSTQVQQRMFPQTTGQRMRFVDPPVDSVGQILDTAITFDIATKPISADQTAQVDAPDFQLPSERFRQEAIAQGVVQPNFADHVRMSAVALKDSFEGMVRLPEFAGRAAGAAITGEGGLSEEEVAKARSGVALGVGLATGTAATKIAASQIPQAIKIAGLPRLIPASTPGIIGSTMAGAAFGATRPRAEEEGIVEAVVTDALVWGGLHLAGSMVLAGTKPLRLPMESEIEAALRPVKPPKTKAPPRTAPRGLETSVEQGKALFEEAAAVSEQLHGRSLAGGQVEVIDATTTFAKQPGTLGLLRAHLSPSKWGTAGGPMGDGAGRIVWNAIERGRISRRVVRELEVTRNLAREALFEGVKKADRPEAVKQLQNAMETVFSPDDIPLTMPANVRKAFDIMRRSLARDRETLRLLQGGSVEWGIDAYMPHVFVGKWAVVDELTGGIRAIETEAGAVAKAAELTAANPGLRLRIQPKEWSIPVELQAMGLSGKALGRFKNIMGRALEMDPDEVAELLLSNRVVRVKPGKKFFGHTIQREANLPGYVMDPFKAHEIYSFGFARKVAFHDFEQKSRSIIDQLAAIPGIRRADITVLNRYVDDVLGRPSLLEQQTRELLGAMTRKALRPFGRGVQEKGVSFMDPRNLAGSISWWEAISRLGLSPTAWFVNLSQIPVNVYPELGIKPVIRAVRLLNDRTQTKRLDTLLRALDLDVTVPLATSDAITRQWVSELPVIHPLYLFNKVEQANRAVAGLAKYQDVILKGGSTREAIDSARRFITETQFEYGVADSPLMLRGPLGSVAFQFKKFLVKEMELIWSWRHDPKKLMRFAVAIQSIGGISALFDLPPLSLVNLVRLKGGVTPEEAIQQRFPRASRGIPGMLGVDIGGSLSFSLPTETGELFGPAVADAMAMARLIGESPQLRGVREMILNRSGELTAEERGRAMAQLMPVVVKRTSDAIDVYNSGAVRVRKVSQYQDWARGMVSPLPMVDGVPTYDAAADKLFDPSDPTKEAIMSFVGLRSLERSEFSQFRTQTQRVTQEQRSREAIVVQKIANAYMQGDKTEARRLAAEAQENGLVITKQQLRDAVVDAVRGRTGDILRRLPPERRREQINLAPGIIEREIEQLRQ